MSAYFIASCVFTAHFPELNACIRHYVEKRHKLPVVRCCVPGYRLRHFSGLMPEGPLRIAWESLPDSADFGPGDTVYSLCHNCSAILEETQPQTRTRSLWELVLADADFPLPQYPGREMTVQDCWRAQERRIEQDAVRALLGKMGIAIRELADNFEKTRFCGVSLLRPAPPRNLKLAPRRFGEQAEGFFAPHTEEEQAALMQAHGKQFATREAVAYCHYCLEGLELAGLQAVHLASLLFEPEKNRGYHAR